MSEDLLSIFDDSDEFYGWLKENYPDYLLEAYFPEEMELKRKLDNIRKQQNLGKRIFEPEMINVLRKLVPDLCKLDEFNPSDCHSPLTGLRVECKSRSVPYKTLTINKKKWLFLKQFKDAWYVNSTPEGLYSWDINRLPEPIWYIRKSPATSWSGEGYEGKWVTNEIGYYDIKDATDLSYLL